MIVDSDKQATHIAELLRLVQDEGIPSAQARAIGAELADYYLSAGRADDAPLAEFTADAYLGFDARVAKDQAKVGRRRR